MMLLESLSRFIDKNAVELVIKKNGKNKQVAKCAEELAELSVEIMKCFDGKEFELADNANLVDEIADAIIMLEQLVRLSRQDNKVQQRIVFKCDRMKQIYS